MLICFKVQSYEIFAIIWLFFQTNFASRNFWPIFAMNILATLLLTHQHQKMKKISLLLVALVAVFCVSCSNDPKVEGEFVKAVDEAIAQFENAKTMDDLTAFAQKIEEISNNEAFGNLKETGAAKEASERLEKCVDGMDKKAEEITANMLNSITGENAGEAEEPAEEWKKTEHRMKRRTDKVRLFFAI